MLASPWALQWSRIYVLWGHNATQLAANHAVGSKKKISIEQRLTFFWNFSVYPCSQSNPCAPGPGLSPNLVSSPMLSQSEAAAQKNGQHGLEDIGSGHWYIPLEAPHSSSTSQTPDGSTQQLLSLDSGFHLHCPTTFIGTSTAATFLPFNG